CFQGSHVPTF
nr:immunoglobulin light chain junction region [Mus musculus]NSL97271.1 immunoglobulin light chain junction region [Mus musculus]NSL97298.1 immunoglobulin light chain junction region [Mus musculus]NSL97350.1 immunoglobulin light chain junction region [Mus musculus]NSL97403.1 immunoglobulin light chain junction region [Mus musculus]